MKDMETTNKFILCDCQGEGVLLTKFEDDFDTEIYLSIFTQGVYRKSPSFWKRLKFCWWHLKTGRYYDDQIVLSLPKAREVAAWLLENTEQKKGKK